MLSLMLGGAATALALSLPGQGQRPARSLPDLEASLLSTSREQAEASPLPAQSEQPEQWEIPVGGAPEPLTLLPKGEQMSLVTSHFALPMSDHGNVTGMTMDLVDEIKGFPSARMRRARAMKTAAALLQSNGGRGASFLEDMLASPRPPTLAAYEAAMRLLQGSKHHHLAAELVLHAKRRRKAAAKAAAKATALQADRHGMPMHPDVYSEGSIPVLSPHIRLNEGSHPSMLKELKDAHTVFEAAAAHYAMMEAAIVTNVLNYPTLSEVWVVYDGVLPENNCQHLTRRLMDMASRALMDAGFSGQLEGRAAAIRCVDRHGGQPSYKNMFEYASDNLPLENEVVVMGNGDGATDETVGQLSAIQKGVVVMLSVTGFASPWTPDGPEVDDSVLTEWQSKRLVRQPHAQQIFNSLVGDGIKLCDPPPKSRCVRSFKSRRKQALQTFAENRPGDWNYFRWPEQILSWDGYVFRRPLPPLSGKVLHPNIHMNMPGAENRAGMALYLALGKDALIYNNTLPNACGHVNWYHYHCTGGAVEYKAVDNVGITTHEWRTLFGNASVPPQSALLRGSTLAVGVDESTLSIVTRDLIVPMTSGCSDLGACLHGGKTTHHSLPDEIAYLGYDPTCTQPECIAAGLAPPEEELNVSVATSVEMWGQVATAPPSRTHEEAQEQLEAAQAEASAVAKERRRAQQQEGQAGLGAGARRVALTYERAQAHARCKHEAFLPVCAGCRNELHVQWGFAAPENSAYRSHLPSSDPRYDSNKIQECMLRCQHEYGSASSPIQAFSLDSHARCACAADDCAERVAVPLPTEGNAAMDMTAAYTVRRTAVARAGADGRASVLASDAAASCNEESTLTIHVGEQFADAHLITQVLHANGVGLLEEKNVLYPLASPDWGGAHHFWVAQACQCNPFVIVEHIYYASTRSPPQEYPMESMHRLAADQATSEVVVAHARRMLARREATVASRAAANAAKLVAQAGRKPVRGTPRELARLSAQAQKAVGLPRGSAGHTAASLAFHTSLARLHAKAMRAARGARVMAPPAPDADGDWLGEPGGSAARDDTGSWAWRGEGGDPEEARDEQYHGNTPPYVGHAFEGLQEDRSPLGSNQRYMRELADPAATAVKYDDNGTAPRVFDPSSAAVGAAEALATVPGVQPTPGSYDATRNSDGSPARFPAIPASHLDWPSQYDGLEYNDPDMIKVPHEPFAYPDDEAARRMHWALVDETDTNGVGQQQSLELWEALTASLGAHSGPKVLSSFTLMTVSLEALMETKRMVDRYACTIRVVGFYRNSKDILLERYRNQDLFKVTLDKLGAFEYATQTMEELVFGSENSTAKGMQGLTVDGEAMVGSIETALTRHHLNTTAAWDRMIAVFGRDHFRLIEYAAVKVPGNTEGYDVTSALLEVATATATPSAPHPAVETAYDRAATYTERPYTDCLASIFACYEQPGTPDAECEDRFAECIRTKYDVPWIAPSPEPATSAAPAPGEAGAYGEPSEAYGPFHAPIKECIAHQKHCQALHNTECNAKLVACIKGAVKRGNPLPSPGPDNDECDAKRDVCLHEGTPPDVCEAKRAVCINQAGVREAMTNRPPPAPGGAAAAGAEHLQRRGVKLAAPALEPGSAPSPPARPPYPPDSLERCSEECLLSPRGWAEKCAWRHKCSGCAACVNEWPQLPADVRAAAETPPFMSDREVAARQLWHEFRGYAYTRLNCTVMWPWQARKSLFSSILPLATWELPMRCFNVSSLDAEALALDERVRRAYGDVLLHADQPAAVRAIVGATAPFCELDRSAVRADPATWTPRFRQQLLALPYGACLEGQDELAFMPPPVYVQSPPPPPCDTIKPATLMDPADWAGLPPPLPPPPPSPPPLNEEFTAALTAAMTTPHAFACKSRAADRPFTRSGVPTQYVHVPKAAGSSIQMLLLYYVAIPQEVFFVVGEVEDYPKIPPGTVFVGHTPFAGDPASRFEAKRNFARANPFYMATFRDPLERLLSLYDYRALFNMSTCSGELDADGYYPRIGFLDIWFPGPSLAQCMMIEQMKQDEADAVASGVPETALMDHFFRARHPHVLSMALETQYSWFVPRDDTARVYPTASEAALACAMKNALRTDVLINSERFNDVILPAIAYHAPDVDVAPGATDAMTSNERGARAPQVLSPEVEAEIRRLPSFVRDQRFYDFAQKIARAREVNMFNCLGTTDGPCNDSCETDEAGEPIITDDEYLMIKNANCGLESPLSVAAPTVAFSTGGADVGVSGHSPFDMRRHRARAQELQGSQPSEPCDVQPIDTSAIDAAAEAEKANVTASIAAKAEEDKAAAIAAIEAQADAAVANATAQIDAEAEREKEVAEASAADEPCASPPPPAPRPSSYERPTSDNNVVPGTNDLPPV